MSQRDMRDPPQTLEDASGGLLSIIQQHEFNPSCVALTTRQVAAIRLALRYLFELERLKTHRRAP